jgi:hypothetical protein
VPTTFTLVVLCFGAAALQAPPATADAYAVVYGTPPLNPPKFPLSVVARAGATGDRWTGNVVLLGPQQTGKPGRWEVRNFLTNVLVYEAEGWDGAGFCDFTRVNPTSPPACRVAVFP